MKKLSFLFFLALLPLMASAQTLIDGIYYNLNTDTKEAEATSCYYSVSSLAIPSSVTYDGVTYSVTSIGNRGFRRNSNMLSVTIANSVTIMGAGAF